LWFHIFISRYSHEIQATPEKNMWYGYRTSLSTSSDKAWQLAQEHSTKAMFKYGFMMMLVE